ncbi:MAG: hypothetical protein K0S38_32 [Candidatus Paceibacter sp.]|jgi:hypothetical protein|nr:hypothetical protein [Candidatus Paceibacter sp.]
MKNRKFIPLIIVALILVAGVAGFLLLSPSQNLVKADSAHQYTESFIANLTPQQEIDIASSTASTTLTSTGSGIFNVTSDTTMINYEVKVSSLSSAIIGAHLHCAPVGRNGQIVAPLNASSTMQGVGSTTGTLSGSIMATDITNAAQSCNPNITTLAHLVQAMREGNIYVNIHTVNYPMGEIRGQLMRSNEIMPFGSATTTMATSTATSTPTIATSTATTTDTTSTTTASTTTPQATSTSGTTTSPVGWQYVFVQPDAYYKIQGSSIRFMGTHFIPGEMVTISTNGASGGTVVADSSGNFTSNWMTVPFGVGMRTYNFIGGSSQISFPVQINVGNGNPWIVLSTYYAGLGAPLTVTGHQFGANENVTIWFNGMNVGTARTDNMGDFSFSTTVPNNGAGQWSVTVKGESTNMTASQPFSQSS